MQKELVYEIGRIMIRVAAATAGHPEFCACSLCTMRGLSELMHSHALAVMDVPGASHLPAVSDN